MDKRKIETGIVAVVLFSAFMTLSAISIVQASIIYVPDNYTLIQDAVRAASPGDTIIVREVTYNESIEVDKPLTIRSKNGPDSTTIRAEYPDEPVFEITADYVNISGFTVTGAYEDAGIELSDVNYCNISNNICTNNKEGIYIILSNNNSISNNNCSYNTLAGIILLVSNNNSISNNNCSYNTLAGILLEGSSNNSISNNKCLSNINRSIYLWNSCNNCISNNTCSNSRYGILLTTVANNNSYIVVSNNNSISNNNCSYNTMAGIILEGSSNNSISNNKCLSNINVSIYLWDSCNNSLSKNTCSNSRYGIFLATAANNNIFYLNNFINNSENAFYLESTNMWNSISVISYTYNKTAYQNYLGNYWDDYSRSDKNNDGIGDRTYRIDGDRDRYPLMKPWENYFS